MTLEELQKRHSVRAYQLRDIDTGVANMLRAEATMITTHEAGLKFSLTFGDDTPFKAFSRSYGIFNNVRNYLTVIAETSFPDALERAGYFAEQFVMKAVEAGLGTCYVGGTYESSKLHILIRPGEELLFLVAFGYPLEKERLVGRMMAKLVHRNDRPWTDFFDGSPEDLDKALAEMPWLQEGLEAVACAPSALNKRPVRIAVDPSGDTPTVTAYVDTKNERNLIDLGIAKYNFASVCDGDWEWGNHSQFYRNAE